MNNEILLKWEKWASQTKKCTKCDLGCEKLLDGYDPHVIGQGAVPAKIMFVAESPGLQETIYQRPLTPPGTSGKLYEKVLKTLDLTREEVYTSNTTICRPPKNRDPEPWEVLKCKPNLIKQLELVQPDLVITFGRFAAQVFLGNFKITKEHGRLRYSKEYNVDVFPLYHPAYVSAYASKDKREEFKNDIKILKNILKEI
jgi:DNA polymerase